MTIIVETAEQSSETLEAVPRRRPGLWLGALAVLALVVFSLDSLARNPRMRWGVVGEYLFSAPVLKGLGNTLQLTLIVMLCSAALGILLAVMHQSKNPILTGVSVVYVWIFRSVPPLVQLLVWFNLAAIYPVISFGVPYGPTLWKGSANDFITPFIAAIIGLGLNSAAYMCEIIRGGIMSVDAGQVEAAHSLGLTRAVTMRRIVLPQAFRVIVPPTGNEVITVLKATSLVSVISMTDLLYSVELIYAKNFENIPLLMVACIWYLVVTSVLTVGQHFLERRLQRGFTLGAPEQSVWKRLHRALSRLRTEPTGILPGTRNGAEA